MGYLQGKQKIKVILAKSALDSHDVGLRYIAKLLMDAGMEVVIIRYDFIEELVKVAMEEDVDCIGISYYCTGLEYEIPTLRRLLKEKGMDDVVVLVGGCINEEEKQKLVEWGVKGIFTPNDKPGQEVIDCIVSNIPRCY